MCTHIYSSCVYTVGELARLHDAVKALLERYITLSAEVGCVCTLRMLHVRRGL